MPGDSTDLETAFTCPEYQYVGVDDSDYAVQCATNEYAMFLWKNKNSDSSSDIYVTWKGQSNLDTSTSTMYLQIYNTTTSGWETLASNNTTSPDTEFTLSGSVTSNVSNYYAVDNWINCRIYQEDK